MTLDLLLKVKNELDSTLTLRYPVFPVSYETLFYLQKREKREMAIALIPDGDSESL